MDRVIGALLLVSSILFYAGFNVECPACPTCPGCVFTTTPKQELQPHQQPQLSKSSTSNSKDMLAFCDDFTRGPPESKAIIPELFCMAYPLVYQQEHQFTQADDLAGRDFYQMSFEQYFAIFSAILTLPGRPLHDQRPPKVLQFGCGADAPAYVRLLEYLGGKLEMVDNNKQWAAKCERHGAKVHFMEMPPYPGGVEAVYEVLKDMDGFTTPLTDTRYDNLRAPYPPEFAETAWDVIVVDGPQ